MFSEFAIHHVPLSELRRWNNGTAAERWRGAQGSALIAPLDGIKAELVILCSPRHHIFGMPPRQSEQWWNDWIFTFSDPEGSGAPAILAECARLGVEPSEVKDLFPIDIDGTEENPYDVSPHWFSKWLIPVGGAARFIAKYVAFIRQLNRFALIEFADEEVARFNFWLPSGASREGVYQEAVILFNRLGRQELGASSEEGHKRALVTIRNELLALCELSGSGDPDVLNLKPFDLVQPQLTIPVLDSNVSPMRSNVGSDSAAQRLLQRAGRSAEYSNYSEALIWEISALRACIVDMLDWPSVIYRIEQALSFDQISNVAAIERYGRDTVGHLRAAHARLLKRYPSIAATIV